MDQFVTTDATGSATSVFTVNGAAPQIVAPSTTDYLPLQCLSVTSVGPDFDNCLFRWLPPVSEPAFTKATPNGNPRAGIVTLIASTTGEEGCGGVITKGGCMCGASPCPVCSDTSKNNCFVDLPEPFIDENDNGNWDPGERFIDTNQNGKWDGPNGMWDAQIVIWKSFRVVWAGSPIFGSGYSEVLMGGKVLAALPALAPCSTAPPVTFRFIDLNGNPPAAAAFGSSDSVTATSTGNANATVPVGDAQTANMMGFGYYSTQIYNTNCATPPGPPVPSTVSFIFRGTTTPGGTQDTYSLQLNGNY
jgi:hypothetical protein